MLYMFCVQKLPMLLIVSNKKGDINYIALTYMKRNWKPGLTFGIKKNLRQLTSPISLLLFSN